MNDKWLKNAREIIDLIEDKEFPARRNITDYILLLLNDLDIDTEKVKELENFFAKEYEKKDDDKSLLQS